jgi:uncharacterized cupredoxin-like copper-binding protein
MSATRSLIVMVAIAAVTGGMNVATAAASAPTDNVRLIEFKIQPTRGSVAAGKTKFVVKNAGADEHEFVVVRGHDPAALPTKSDGSVDEDQIPKSNKLGELGDIKPGKTKSKTFKLPAGSYIAFCNIVDKENDGSVISHFAKGMYTTLVAS